MEESMTVKPEGQVVRFTPDQLKDYATQQVLEEMHAARQHALRAEYERDALQEKLTALTQHAKGLYREL
jgi:predicted methyltransferase